MKRQIDPNLDNLFDDLLSNDDTPTANESGGADFFTGDNIDEKKKPENRDFVMDDNTHHSEHHSTEHHHHSEHHEHHEHHGEHHHSEHHEHHHDDGHHHEHHGDGHHSHHSHSTHGSHGSHHHKRRKNKKKLSTAAKIAIIILIILLLLIFGIVFAFVYLEYQGKSDFKSGNNSFSYQETIEYKGETYTYNDKVVSIAFIGVDKRELGADEEHMGTAGQADTDILLTIDTRTGKAKAIAVPRDTMVDVDVYSESGIFLNSKPMQLCLSYAYGDGRQSSANNVTTSLSRILYNVPITKYFALDLDGIEAINDAVGGVTLTALSTIKSPSFEIIKGEDVHLVGGMTEAYVRTRDMDNIEASLERTQRQVQYIKAFTAQLVPKVINDFGVVSRLYNTASDYSSTNISLSNATYLGTLLMSKGVTTFDTVTLKGEMKLGSTTSPDQVYAEFYPDEDELMQVVLDTFYTKN